MRRLRWRRRRRRSPLLLAAGGALSLAVASAISVASLSGIDVAGAAISKGKSFIQLMNQRSPGKRTAAQLIKTKGKHKYYQVLTERPPPEMPPPEYQPLVDIFAPPPELFAQWPELPGFALAENPIFPPGVFVPCCGVFVPPTGPTPPPPPPPPPPAGVPEPATWMTMIVGFGLSGWALRRRRASHSKGARV